MGGWQPGEPGARSCSCECARLGFGWCGGTGLLRELRCSAKSRTDLPVSVSSIHQLRNEVSEEHEIIKKKELETGPKASYGYGGKFGTEQDRMDKVPAVEGFLEPQWKSALLKNEGASLFPGLTLKGGNGRSLHGCTDSHMSN